MCGINGFTFADKKLCTRMNNAIKHRGPDASVVWADTKVTLGHRRLAIIDLSRAAEQPMRYTHKGRTAVIVFNGEIYNFNNIKIELEAKGYQFKTKSDTEVILASYLEWGTECVNRFNGMWSFCIYDTHKQELFCSRDRAGKKPFYYYLDKKQFIFSSEIKGILEHTKLKINTKENVDPLGIQLYFSFGYLPAPHTIYKNMYKLGARRSLIYDLKKKKIVREWEYYTLPKYAPVYDRAALIKEGRELLADSVRLRMIADVPVGAFLSGGLDSSTIVGEMTKLTKREKLHTFSIGFKGKYDETKFVDIVKNAFKTNHHHRYFTKEDFEELIPVYSDIYDEPFADYSGFPTTVVSKLAREYVTVSLSGDGGDEVFGGYPSHQTGRQMDLIRKAPWPIRKLGSIMPVKKDLTSWNSSYMLKSAFKLSLKPKNRFLAEALTEDNPRPKIFQDITEKRLTESLERGDGSLREAMRIYDLLYNTVPDHYLVKVDRASMHHSLEIRCPFLDYRFMEFSQKIPAEWKLDSFKTKKLMRDIIRGIVPDEITERKDKRGFTPPIPEWIFEEKYERVIQSGLERINKLAPDLHSFYKNTVLTEKNSKNSVYTTHVIKLFLFSLWWNRWIETD